MSLRIVSRGATGAVMWAVPATTWRILWNGPGSRLYLVDGRVMVPIEHYTADGNYRTQREAARAAEAFIKAPVLSRGSQASN